MCARMSGCESLGAELWKCGHAVRCKDVCMYMCVIACRGHVGSNHVINQNGRQMLNVFSHATW